MKERFSSDNISYAGKSSRSKKSSESSEEKKRKVSDDDFVGYKISQSNILSDLDAANAEYEETWRNINESDNPNQTYVLSMVRAQKTAEVEAELRKVIFI